MTKPSQHVVPHPQGWAVRKSGSERATETFPTQREAIDRARGLSKSQETELFIHDRHGRIRARDSFGNDPYPPKG
jgi:hypothetical protein